ncbi:hypothetical protein D3C80_1823200 [compost metagenome]
MHFLEHRRKKVPIYRIDSRNTHMPSAQPAQVVELLADAVKIFLPVVGGMQQQLSRSGQPQPGGVAFKQRHRQLFFNPQYLPIDRRCGNVQGFGRLAK